MMRSRDIRFLEEAAKFGELTVLLWSDETLLASSGRVPKFPLSERLYFLQALRFVAKVIPVTGKLDPDALPEVPDFRAVAWVDMENTTTTAREAFCRARALDYHVIHAEQLGGFPHPTASPANPDRKKVVVTGCYDWLHSGHVRFFEEVSSYGELYVVVGHDANIRVLKGVGHPLLPQEERRYLVGSIKYVKESLVSTGEGWLDAEPEIRRLRPDIYAVNEDGDKGGKREYCEKLGLEYLVLKRTPAPGLPRRTSTNLRGF